jgi:hypothetical protein
MKKLALATLPLLLSTGLALAQTPKEIALAGLDAVFVNPNPERVKELFSPNYIQHNPMFPNGPETVIGFATNPPPGFSYEMRVPRDDGQSFHGIMGTDSRRRWAATTRDRGQV